jgi:hypothetical protein
MLAYLYWPLAVALMAIGQGLVMPAIRRTPPGPEASRQAFGLHYLLTLAYFLPVALAPHTWPLALLARLLLFDPLLNLAAGEPLFDVGKTALSDRAFQWLAARIGWPAEHVRFAVWMVCLGLAAGGLLLLYKV